MKFPITHDFTREVDTKAQALKVLEEAAELVEADKSGDYDNALEEAMDILQALANYCECKFYEVDLESAYTRVFTKNWNRGYYDANYGGSLYDEAEQHAKSLGLDL